MSHIRDGAREEIAELEALQLRASLVWEEYRAQLLAHPNAVRLDLDAFAASRVRVAMVDLRRAGFSVVLAPRDGVSELDGLFVEPDLWGKGVGRALMDDVVDRARGQGARQLAVIANPNAAGFYEKLAMRVAEVAQTRFGPAHWMRLELG